VKVGAAAAEEAAALLAAPKLNRPAAALLAPPAGAPKVKVGVEAAAELVESPAAGPPCWSAISLAAASVAWEALALFA
jgi:hypothetical protein